MCVGLGLYGTRQCDLTYFFSLSIWTRGAVPALSWQRLAGRAELLLLLYLWS